MTDHFSDIELPDAIQAVRDQLIEAAARAGDADLRFEVGEIRLEFTVELRRDAKVRGGVRAWLLAADAEASSGRRRGHTVSVTLTPKDRATGLSPLVGNPEPALPDGFD